MTENANPTQPNGFTEEWIRLAPDEIEANPDMEIEKLIVEKLVARHSAWIEKGVKKSQYGAK